MRNRNPWHLLLIVLGLLGSGYALPAQAAGVITNCGTFGATATPGVYIEGTLGAALVGGGEVTFACSGPATIIVTRITLDVDTTINNPTGHNVTLSGNNTNLVLLINEGWKVDLINLTITQGIGGIYNRGGTVTLTNCTVSANNNTGTSGGGIDNRSGSNQDPIGTMSLIDTTVSDNSAAYGGGIRNLGTMTLIRSTVSTNNGASLGGGIYNDGTMTFTDSIVSDNSAGSAGGIWNTHQLNLIHSTVSGNRAIDAINGRGGGIYSGSEVSGTLTLTNSTVSGNYATAVGGGLYVGGRVETVTITNSTVSNNTAGGSSGGIANFGAQTTITNSTISGNTAGTTGGGINNFVSTGNGQLTITNSTLSGNTAGTTGGGIYNYAPLILTHVTFSDNSVSQGNSLYVVGHSAVTTTIANTLIATSSAVGNCVDALNLITDIGYNLSSDNTCHLTSGTSLPNTNPNLGPLADNGGPTQTHALLAGSQAIDLIPSGANGCGTTITADQRGVTRPQGANCDSGAYEVAVVIDAQPPTGNDLSATPNPAPPNAAVTLTATLDDTTTGGSNIASAEYNVDGGDWTLMDAADGAFDSPLESVTATLTFAPSQVGTNTICVRGTDAFGNTSNGTACTTVTVSPVDETPPVITPTVSGTLGNNGWYTSDVAVSWTVTDGESDITSQSGCDHTTVTTDTAGVTYTCEATSDGGAASEAVTIQRDGTLPIITGSANPPANANGWRNSPVTVDFTCTDDTSGIATCTTAQPLGEGANQSASGTATDNAGNTANTQVTDINVDLTAPEVTVTGVTNDAIYTLGAVPAAGCDTTDALSGVQTPANLSVAGDSSGLGTFTASCTGATDNADNLGSASVTYQVIAPPVTCAVDASSQVSIIRGGFRYNRGTGRFMQQVTLTATAAVPGPVSLVLDNLSGNATLYGAAGATTCTTPQGSPYINANVGSDNTLTAGERVTVVLEFVNPSKQGIAYTTRILAGADNR